MGSSRSEDAVRRGTALRRLLLRHGVRADGDVLDVGCGEGGVASAFSSSRRIVGTDASVDLLVRGQRSGHAVALVAGDAATLPFRDSSFDAVLLFDVLEHVLDWPAALRESARVLRAGGAVFVTAANPRSPITILDDPHWHLPLVAVLPPRASQRLVRWLRKPPLEMAGIHPALPSWDDLHAAFRRAGLAPFLISNVEKVVDPDSIVDPARRRLGAMLHERGMHRWGLSLVLRPLVWLYDTVLGRSWTFLAFKA
jgi:SAM-dependent methyltransferase